jgi:outer membrane lipopolysaccharide assembly protein LptE/RlpB
MQSHDCAGLTKYLRRFSEILLLCLLFSGCGYHFQGTGTGLAPEIRSVAIPIFANRTLQTGIETEVTRALVDRFTSARRLEVTGRSTADALLTGTVRSLDNYPVALSGSIQAATQYRLTVVLEMTLVQQQNGKVLWKGEMSDWRIYSVDPSLAATENNKQEAIRQISTLLAEKIYSVILENF